MKFLLLMFLVAPFLAFSQEPGYIPNIQIDTNTHKINFTEVVSIPSVAQQTLYNRAFDWIGQNYAINHLYITMADRAKGRLIARGTAFGKSLGLTARPLVFNYNIYILVKDGRYKYSVTDFVEPDGFDFDEKLPVFASSDDFVNDSKYRNAKGEYKGSAKTHLYYIQGAATTITLGLKDALSSDRSDYKHNEDEF